MGDLKNMQDKHESMIELNKIQQRELLEQMQSYDDENLKRIKVTNEWIHACQKLTEKLKLLQSHTKMREDLLKEKGYDLEQELVKTRLQNQ